MSKVVNLEIVADGYCKNNGKENAKAGGSFAILQDGEVKYKTTAGYEDLKTNQAAEMQAVADAVKYVDDLIFRDKGKHKFTFVVKTDSEYVVKSVSGEFKDITEETAKRAAKIKAILTHIQKAHKFAIKLIHIDREEVVPVLGH